MAQRMIVVISGPVASGKSLLARALANRFGGAQFSTSELLKLRMSPEDVPTHQAVQRLEAQLESESDGRWLIDLLVQRIADTSENVIIVDRATTAEQIAGLREAFGWEVHHVHVTASRDTCSARYEQERGADVPSNASYDVLIEDPLEKNVEELAQIADILVNTDRDGPRDLLVRVAAQLGLLDRWYAPCVDVIVGGAYGSEGKGNIAFYLAPEYDLLIRVGGPNAAHKVYLASGEVFTHYSLPSGTLAGQAHLLLGPGAVVEPEELLAEMADCNISSDRLSIDPHVMIIEDEDKAREAVLREKIGSTVSGTGSATARRLLREDGVRFASDVADLQPYINPAWGVLEHAYASGQRIMLEGTQGSGLSLHHGPYPHVTSRDTNVAGCLAEAGIAPARVRNVVLVVRTYPIRVGGESGPLTTELTWEEIERRSGLTGLAEQERTSRTGNVRRVGEPEWDLLRRAALLNSPTDIALTFADYIDAKNGQAWRFEQLTEETIKLVDEIERVTGARVSLISTGFMPRRGIIDRRHW